MSKQINSLPDIQENSKPKICRPIPQVGVESVELPMMLENKTGGFVDVVAMVSIRTSLGSETKGISMSRLLLTLKDYLRKPLKHHLLHELLKDLQKNIGSDNSFIKFEFKLPLLKKSIKTDNSFPLYYKCKFEAQLNSAGYFRFFQEVKVQYSSYCPCSAELSKHLLETGCEFPGFPHAQRSFATVVVESKEPNYIWLEDIIGLVESAIKTLPYPIVKRIDEQEIARIASNNPIFVEDAIRFICDKLDDKIDIYDWIVKCVHQESIHTSDAIAISYKGIESGFDDTYFL